MNLQAIAENLLGLARTLTIPDGSGKTLHVYSFGNFPDNESEANLPSLIPFLDPSTSSRATFTGGDGESVTEQNFTFTFYLALKSANLGIMADIGQVGLTLINNYLKMVGVTDLLNNETLQTQINVGRFPMRFQINGISIDGAVLTVKVLNYI